jgi:putative Holliday junction resolvase
MSAAVRRRGVWLAVDPGEVRIGVAACDPDQVLASPIATVTPAESVEAVASLAGERAAVGVVVGLALSLSGDEGAAADAGRRYARRLAARIPEPVYLVDERLTTVSAGASLRSAGHSGRSARTFVDQVAAAGLLQGVLDAAASRGTDVGAVLASGLGERVPAGEPS